MMKHIQENIRKIALINFGGIGDEILFSPVVEEIRRYFPEAHLTLFLEDRSSGVRDLIPGINSIVEVTVIGKPRWKLFLELIRMLRSKFFDAVISSGSSPFIPVMLFLTGIQYRVGFQTGRTSHRFLTVEAPLNLNQYAGDMYFSLAKSFLQMLLPDEYQPSQPVIPHLKAAHPEESTWAETLLQECFSSEDANRPKLFIHPGVSRISIQKNILKSWDALSWAKLIQQLTGRYRVCLSGGPDDEEIVGQILENLPKDLPHFTNLYGLTRNLRQLAALMAQMDLILSVDSAPMHLAVGLRKPLVAMFGPTDEKKLLPSDDVRFQAIRRNDLACRPCLWDQRATSCDRPECLDVSVDAMAEAVEGMMKYVNAAETAE